MFAEMGRNAGISRRNLAPVRSGQQRSGRQGAERRLDTVVAAFVALWLLIGMVAAYDAYLTVKYLHMLHRHELNPIGRWIMQLDWEEPVTDTAHVAAFLGYKFAGTVLVLGALSALYWYKPWMGLTVAGALGAFQAALALFLTFA